jgi:purine-binding chemotaxis protein CheW
MDFLKIRRKAKERAAGQGASSPAPADAETPARAEAAGERSAPPVPPALEDGQEPSRPDDPRFTTWKPGSGPRPEVLLPRTSNAPRPDAADFAVYDPSRATQVLEPVPAFAVPPAPAPALASLPPDSAPARAERREPQAASVADPLDEFFFHQDETVAALTGLPAEPEAPATSRPEDAAVEEYLTFRLGAEEYAVAIEYVREVLKAPPITEVPRAPAGILGVVNVRGEVVAIFDPRRRLGLPTPPAVEGSARVVIVDDGEGPCGLLVDAVASVVRLPRGSVEPCPQGIGGASADCLAGIGRERSRLFTVLDLPAVLRRGPAPERGGRREHAGG